jgi:hypothetical protein
MEITSLELSPQWFILITDGWKEIVTDAGRLELG